MTLYIILAVLLVACILMGRALLKVYGNLMTGVMALSRGTFDKKLVLPGRAASAAGEVAPVPAVQEQQLQQELKQLEELVARRTEELQEACQARLNLQANLAHDLRTPLTLIQGYVEALQDGVAASEQERQQYLSLIYTRVLTLNRLIRELFELSRWEEGQIRLEQSEVALGDWLEQVCVKYEEDVRQAGLELNRDFGEQAAGRSAVQVDAPAMERVFANILFNAIRHTPSGGAVTVGMKAQPDGLVTVMIGDTGCGVDEAEILRIFDRHWRGQGGARSPGGGLGLAIAKEIVTLHGGTIRAANSAAGGLTVSVSLPVQRSA